MTPEAISQFFSPSFTSGNIGSHRGSHDFDIGILKALCQNRVYLASLSKHIIFCARRCELQEQAEKSYTSTYMKGCTSKIS